MKKNVLFLSAFTALAGTAFGAAPAFVEPAVTLRQASTGKPLEIRYVVTGAPAIVTCEIFVDGAPIGAAKRATVSGAGRKVGVGEQVIRWRAREDFPECTLKNVSAKVRLWAVNAPPSYMAVDLTATNAPVGEAVTFYDGADNVPGGVSADVYKETKLLMRRIPAAGVTWLMGSPEIPVAEAKRAQNEKLHAVTLTSDYYMGVYPVTVGQYRTVRGSVPSNSSVRAMSPLPADADHHPVSGVSYGYTMDDTGVQNWLRYNVWPERRARDASVVYAEGFLGRLQRLSGRAFDLPTSAEWEFACRAGDDGPVYGGFAIGDVAWTAANASATKAVGQKFANAWGLYDMLGNVWEWCVDIYYSNMGRSDAPEVDPAGPTMADAGYTQESQVYHCRRGGNYTTASDDVRAAYYTGRQHTGRDAMLGFRVCCPVGETW